MTEEELHNFRKQIDALITISETDLDANYPQRGAVAPLAAPVYAREMALVRTRLQEAKMWAGKCLEVLGAPFPEELRDSSTAGVGSLAPTSTPEPI